MAIKLCIKLSRFQWKVFKIGLRIFKPFVVHKLLLKVSCTLQVTVYTSKIKESCQDNLILTFDGFWEMSQNQHGMRCTTRMKRSYSKILWTLGKFQNFLRKAEVLCDSDGIRTLSLLLMVFWENLNVFILMSFSKYYKMLLISENTNKKTRLCVHV